MTDKKTNSTKIYLLAALVAALGVLIWLYGQKASETQTTAVLPEPPAAAQTMDVVNPDVAPAPENPAPAAETPAVEPPPAPEAPSAAEPAVAPAAPETAPAPPPAQ